MRLAKTILRRLVTSPFRTAVVDDQRTWNGLTLAIAAWHIGAEIKRRTKSARVGLMLPTSGMFPAAAVGAWMKGYGVVPVNYLLKRDDLEYVLKDAEVDAVVTVGPMLDLVGGLPEGINAIRLDQMSFKGLPPVSRSVSLPDDFLAVILYTSGTSARPKGVMLTTGNLAANVEQCVEWADFTRQDVIMGVLPQFHTFGLTVLTLLPLMVGCKVIYTARFMPKRIIDLMREHRPTALIAIPSMYNALRLVKSAGPDALKSLRYAVSGGEPLPEAVFEGFKEKFNITINEGYGLTETAPVTNWCRPHEHVRRSVGRALPRVDEKIAGPHGERLGPNQDGEVCIKGPNVMQGYFKRPQETAAVFDNEGFFKTGDMGRFNDEGHLFITGRIKEMMIIGGENVFPREIEEVLNRHPSVKDSAVVGGADESRGEVAIAFVELKDGETFDETALRSHCREHLAQFKVPREIRHMEKLPRNPTGKILRRELAKEVKTVFSGKQ
jgi:long-chain acyl-CoA synthetase